MKPLISCRGMSDSNRVRAVYEATNILCRVNRLNLYDQLVMNFNLGVEAIFSSSVFRRRM